MLNHALRSILQATAHRAALALIAAVATTTAHANHLNLDFSASALATYQEEAGGAARQVASNTVEVRAKRAATQLRFFRDASFSREALAQPLTAAFFLQATAPGCNSNTQEVETLSISVSSLKTGDVQVYTATETQANSGLFRTGPDAKTSPSRVKVQTVEANATEDGHFTEVGANDTLTAIISGCGEEEQARILVDPSGVVFDALTDAPLAGATVTLIDVTGAGNGGNAGGPATVFSYDAVTPSANPVVSGPDGVYAFPLVPPSEYRLQVVPPSTAYDFPSRRPPSQLPPGRTVRQPASYGINFPINAMTGDVVADIPIDPHPRALRVQKTASRGAVEIAETLEYTVVVRNVGEFAVDAATLRDELPLGFSYVPGSLLLDGARAADPQGGRGPTLAFDLGAMAVDATRTLRYRLLVGPNALQGDGVNRAQAFSSRPETIASNVASAKVTVRAGVFSDRAFVLGTVFADCNRNGVKDEQEPGVPGVRLFLEDGSFVSTDGEGRYSLYGLRPMTHVLKVDAASLPFGATLAAVSQRHAGDGNSRFIDVRRGELHRADFAVEGCAPDLISELRQRRARQSHTGELAASVKAELRADAAPRPAADVRSLSASGVVGENAANRAATQGAVDGPGAPPQPLTPGQLLEASDPTLDFPGLKDLDLLPATVPVLRAKGRAGARISLEVNGAEIGDERIGLRMRDDVRQVDLREYIGIVLRPGLNSLVLTEFDAFGNARGRRELRVRAAGALARLRITPPAGAVTAGASAQVGVELLDADGLQVPARTALTLESELGTWNVADLDPQSPGVQAFVEGGRATFDLSTPSQAGETKVRVSAGQVEGDARLAFMPELRPMMAVGIVEGRLDLRRLDPRSFVATRSNDGFEEELHEFASTGGDGGASARAAVFLKGKIKGDALLTIGYDSDKDTRERLFRDIQPDEFYPVYGDSSVRGFDAQSTSRLYVKVEKNRSWLLFGDLTTQAVSSARQLGAYQRSLTGARQHYETDRVVANAFASRASSRQVVVELRGNGTSGPYLVAAGAVIANSEKVEILVRDRNQPSLVIKSTPMVRFADYDFEPFSGQLLFRAPVPSLDADLNPVSVRLIHEVEQGGEPFWVAGADAQVQFTPALNLGASFVHDANPLDAQQLVSGNVTVTLPALPKTRMTAEVADMRSDLTGSGQARRGEVVHDGERLKLRAHAGRSEAEFVNPASPIASGREEAGARGSYAIDERTRVVGEAIDTGDAVRHARREGARVGIERSFDGGIKVEAGVRMVHDMPAGKQPDTRSTALRGKVATTVPGLPRLSVFGEAEQDIEDSDKRLFSVGGEYQFAQRGRAYLRHELISSLTGPYQLDTTERRNTTVLGIDGNYMKDGRLFSEYRGREGFDGRETEAAIGLRNQWAVADGLRLNTSFERVTALSGAAGNQSMAVTGAFEYTANPLTKTTGRLELRNGDTSRGMLSTAGVARKLGSDWTLLARNVFAMTGYNDGTPDRIQERFQVGAAFRDTKRNLSNGLARYEFKSEDGMAAGEGARRVHSVSAHVDWQPQREMVYTVQGASKFVQESVEGERLQNSAHLVSTRVTRDLKNRWDLGLVLRLLADGRFASRQHGVGAEVGHRIQTNLWLSAGYNIAGFRDRDLSAENDTRRGAYLRLRWKFDEHLFSPGARSRGEP